MSQAALLQRNYARGVQLLKEGQSASAVIDTLKREDPAFETRQIAVVDSTGRSGAVLCYRDGNRLKAREFMKTGASALPIHRRLFEQRARNDETARQMLADAD